MADKVDVLAVIDGMIAFLRNEGFGATEDDEARAAVAELIWASKNYFDGYCVDEADDTFDCSDFGHVTGCSLEQHEAAKRLRDAIARCVAA